MFNYVSEVVCIHYQTDNYFNINIHIALNREHVRKEETIQADIT